MVTGVWYGNDDSSETENMTGGSLPAMTFKEIMTFAHAGLDLKPIPGVAPTVVDSKALVAVAKPAVTDTDERLLQLRTGHLTRRSFDVISNIGSMFRDVKPALPVDVSAMDGFRTPASTVSGSKITEVR